jgi:hypothetical protein
MAGNRLRSAKVPRLSRVICFGDIIWKDEGATDCEAVTVHSIFELFPESFDQPERFIHFRQY